MTSQLQGILKDNLDRVFNRIEDASIRSGRSKDQVRLIAVTKYVDPDIVRSMHQLGLSDFAENRIQVAEPKLTELADLPLRWHWIGHLQTNKVRKVIGRFQEFHSIDRIPLIEAVEDRINRHPEEMGGERIPSYLQVNVSGEETKSGFKVDDAKEAGERILQSDFLDWVGLMTMAPHEENPENARPVFAKLRGLRDMLESKLGVKIPRLSMGMSNDFQVAIEEGATDVRIGSILFQGVI